MTDRQGVAIPESDVVHDLRCHHRGVGKTTVTTKAVGKQVVLETFKFPRQERRNFEQRREQRRP